MESALYQGKVYHQRFLPTQHKFDYDIYLFWLQLDEIDELNTQLTHFSSRSRARVRFKRSDYLGPSDIPLSCAVRQKMTSLGAKLTDGDVFMLGQLRMWGLYFSPVNFYYLRSPQGAFTYLLAEVSNTPWNQRHIRNAEKKERNTGFWAVDVKTAGEYTVELRRWPKEADAAITAELKAGADVPGVTPFRAVPGKFFGATKAHLKLGGKELTLPVKSGDKSVVFKLKLKPGRDELWAKFTDADNVPMGAFYAYVTKLK